MIEVKTLFDGWKSATKEQALNIAKHIYHGATNLKQENKIDYINSKFKGIQFTEDELRC